MNATLKELRQSVKLSTNEAAEKLDISLSSLYKIEQGYRKPSREVILKMSKLYNCTTDDIFLSFNITNSDKNQFAM